MLGSVTIYLTLVFFLVAGFVLILWGERETRALVSEIFRCNERRLRAIVTNYSLHLFSCFLNRVGYESGLYLYPEHIGSEITIGCETSTCTTCYSGTPTARPGLPTGRPLTRNTPNPRGIPRGERAQHPYPKHAELLQHFQVRGLAEVRLLVSKKEARKVRKRQGSIYRRSLCSLLIPHSAFFPWAASLARLGGCAWLGPASHSSLAVMPQSARLRDSQPARTTPPLAWVPENPRLSVFR
jgi:hypothetical protein